MIGCNFVETSIQWGRMKEKSFKQSNQSVVKWWSEERKKEIKDCLNLTPVLNENPALSGLAEPGSSSMNELLQRMGSKSNRFAVKSALAPTFFLVFLNLCVRVFFFFSVLCIEYLILETGRQEFYYAMVLFCSFTVYVSFLFAFRGKSTVTLWWMNTNQIN